MKYSDGVTDNYFPTLYAAFPVYLLPMNNWCKIFLGCCMWLPLFAWGQTGVVKGRVINPNNDPIPGAIIRVLDTEIQTKSDEKGNYRVTVPGGKVYRISFSHSAHQRGQLELEVRTGFTYDRTIKLLEFTLEESVISGERDPTDIRDPLQMQLLPIETEELIKMPGFNRSVEKVVSYMPGVATNSEFSSQYRVRGGNFDENLVYVNGIEIYRPFLARDGQQEGLGFSNPDMAQEVLFSTGGFAAQYGDRLSSVLDITYRRPRDFRATAEVGLLTANLHLEGVISRGEDAEIKKDRKREPGKFTYNMGARRFSTSYLFNSLETTGDYRPNFLDFQGLYTYSPGRKIDAPNFRIRERKNGRSDTLYIPNEPLTISTFVALTRNRYLFEPRGRESTEGTITQAFRFRVGFAGQEVSSYTTGLGALMVEHRPNVRTKFDYVLTAFRTQESELFDVEGGYLLGEVNTNLASDEFNESEFDLGIGSLIRNGRNYLTANVLSAQVKGQWSLGKNYQHKLSLGLQAVYQDTDDDYKEYFGLDSAGYLIDMESRFGLEEFVRAKTNLIARQYKGFLQYEWQLNPTTRLTTGGRLVYHDLIDQWMFSPRVQFVKDYGQKEGGPDLRLRLAGGVYYQPPFYREFRRFDGSLNLDVNAQESAHLIGGVDYQFYSWGRPFKFFSEIYYKRLTNIIPYEIDNIRIRYYPDRIADGYAYGWDFRLNGEFIKGVDSWVSLGILKTAEDVRDDEQGYVRRPSDQRVSFAMYFQDELPLNPTYKVHVSYIYGSGIVSGPPRVFESRTAFPFSPYHRVDLGFSKLLTFRGKDERMGRSGMESLWATVEIFNLLQRANTVSYTWIRDLNNNQFRVSNRLSARLLNFRVVMRFR